MRRRQQPTRPGQIGNHWLSRRPNSPIWCRTWFDTDTRQTCRASLGTDDFAAAGIALAQWITTNVGPDRAAPNEITLARVFVRYHKRHGKHVIGAEAQRVSLAMILRVLPEGLTVAAFTLDAQHEAVRSLQAQGYAQGTIKRGLSAAKAAVNWAWNNGELERPIPFLKLPEGQGRERVLTIEELARLWDTDMPAARARVPRARDRKCGSSRSNPPADAVPVRYRREGRSTSTPRAACKRRSAGRSCPCPTGCAHGSSRRAVRWSPGAASQSERSRVPFRSMRDAAGFGPDVTAYTVRHTIGTELGRTRRAGTGNRRPHGAPHAKQPNHREIHPCSAGTPCECPEGARRDRKRDRTGCSPSDLSRNLSACELRVTAEASGISNPLKPGAGEGIRTLDPNLGKVMLYP